MIIQSMMLTVGLAISRVNVGIILDTTSIVVRIGVGHALVVIHPFVGAARRRGVELIGDIAVVAIEFAYSQV